ncbi:MAG: host attachment protein [Tepidisphaeraceae bacterium]|jgi:protein required for attachment to host cells
MRNSWIVVADAAKARLFFKTEENDHPVLLREFNNIAGHAWEHMFVMHANGEQPVDDGMCNRGVRLGFDEPDMLITRHFAGDLCDMLEKAADNGAFDRLVLVAPKSFLEILRKEIGPSARKLLTATLPKILIEVSGPSLENHLCLAGI